MCITVQVFSDSEFSKRCIFFPGDVVSNLYARGSGGFYDSRDGF